MSTEQKMLDCAKLATQGEWEAEGLYVSEAGEGGSVIASSGMGFPAEQCRANNAHIAASSPANVIALIESKRALEAEVIGYFKIMNSRRCSLIGKKLEDGLDKAEAKELKKLQAASVKILERDLEPLLAHARKALKENQ